MAEPVDFIASLTPPAAFAALADHLESLARDLRRASDAAAALDAAVAHSRQKRQALFEARDVLAARLATMNETAAVTATAAETGLPEASIADFLPQARRIGDRRDRAFRDREICRLARSGLTNAEIARRLAVSDATVHRALRAGRS